MSQSHGVVTEDCAGGDATVNGSADVVTFSNACRSLTVNGSGNVVQIELQSGGTVTVNGSGNRVSYTPVGGAQDAAVAEHGQGNMVIRLAGPPGAAPAGQTGAAIAGSPNTPGVAIQGGNGESVQIGPGGIVAVPAPGTGGAVTITPGGIAAAPGGAIAPAPGQLVLSGNDQNRDEACSGAAVYIEASNSRFTLRGGCKALYIRGDSDVVHVEIEPGAQIGIQGTNTLVYVVLTAPGPNPALLVTGANSRAFLVQHLDDTSGSEIIARVRSGAMTMPGGPAVAGAAGSPSVVITTPQAAMAFARGQSVATLQRDLGAVATPQGTSVSLSSDVLFDFDRDQLRPDALRSLAELSVLIARAHPHGLRIVGYTDGVGTPQYNLDLSGRRARNVEQWLLDYGRVQVAGIDVEGRGAADPVAPNALPDGRDNSAGRQQNRRVEVLLRP